jgi:hypothetical protein
MDQALTDLRDRIKSVDNGRFVPSRSGNRLTVYDNATQQTSDPITAWEQFETWRETLGEPELTATGFVAGQTRADPRGPTAGA